MKKIKYLLILISLFFINIGVSASNRIYNIDINVKLDSDGTGHITEIWNMNVDSKTEVYKALSNLGNSKISNFTASMDGTSYTYQNSWDVDASLSSKAYKNGIYKENGNTELCWGMSNYGKHKYTITYDVSNMIYNVDDAQVLYWRFIDNNLMNPDVEEYSVVVTGPNAFADTLDVWGYGDYGGYAYVKDGYIRMSNADDEELGSSDYAVLLTKFPLNTFSTTNKSSSYSTFSDFEDIANEGATKYDEDSNSIFGDIISFIIFMFPMTIFIIIVLSVASSGDKYVKREIDKKNLNNFRDIPCNKDIFKAYFISNVYRLTKNNTDFLGAVLLKWLLTNKVSIIKNTKEGLFGSKEQTSIKFENSDGLNSTERELYEMMVEAGSDGILESKEMEKWSKAHYNELYKWFDKAISDTRDKYVEEGHISLTEKGKILKSKTYTLDDTLYEEATHLAGLKQYLVEFSRIKEKQPIEVNVWEYYLIYAQIFGIAKEVTQQFKDLYPELIEQVNNGYPLDYSDIMWMNMMSHTVVNAASTAKAAAQAYSGGGGGFSSGGGGGGSFGGGGGGCR